MVLYQYGMPRFGKECSFLRHLALNSISYLAAVCLAPLLISLATREKMTKKTIMAVADILPYTFIMTIWLSFIIKLIFEEKIGRAYIGDISILRGVFEFVRNLFFMDLGFYIAHRILHTQVMYRFHALHHSYMTPTESTVDNAQHPVETILNSLFIFVIPILFLKTHVVIFFGANIYLLIHSALCHNHLFVNYRIPFFSGANEHQEHHQYGLKNHNFAIIFPFVDRLLGTHRPFSEKKITPVSIPSQVKDKGEDKSKAEGEDEMKSKSA